MGEHQIQPDLSGEELRTFTKRLLTDLRALESMLSDNMIESGTRRIGAEQELFLVGEGWRPAGVVMEVLEELDDGHFTTELGKFNLEANLDPLAFGGDCAPDGDAEGRLGCWVVWWLGHLFRVALLSEVFCSANLCATCLTISRAGSQKRGWTPPQLILRAYILSRSVTFQNRSSVSVSSLRSIVFPFCPPILPEKD